MTALLTALFGRLPIGWLQLAHSKQRLAAALAGVAFANILIFMQLGFLGALVESIKLPYQQMDGQILISAADANTLQDGSPLPRQRMFQALATPGVADATSLYHGKLDWKQPDGTIRSLDVFGVDPSASVFTSPGLKGAEAALQLPDVALIDRKTRNVPPEFFARIESGDPYRFEANNRTLSVTGTFDMGGGFSADGYLVVSDQTFLRLFRQRVSGAPNHVLVRTAAGADTEAVIAALTDVLPAEDTKARSIAGAMASDQAFQTTQRPVGIVFGFGVVIGALVGIIIVYQVLSTDVADHLREYATFKAMGYRQRFFLGIVFEEALILAILGFIPGLLIALALYAAVTAVTGLPVAMPPTRAIAVLAATIAMCTVSGAIATRRLASANPADLF